MKLNADSLATIVLLGLVCGLPLALGGVTTSSTYLLYVTTAVTGGWLAIIRIVGLLPPLPKDRVFLGCWLVVSTLILADPLIDLTAVRTPDPLLAANRPSLFLDAIESSVQYWCKFTAFLLVSWIMYRLPRVHGLIVLGVICFIGFFEAIYGLINYSVNAQTIFGVWRSNPQGYISGSFYNQNHFSGFLELTLPLTIGLGLFVAKIARPGPRSVLTAFIFVSALLQILAIVVSRSRMGLVAMIVGQLFLVVMLLRHTGNRRNFLLIAGAGFIVGVCAAIWIGLSPVVDKYINLLERGSSRVDMWSSAFEFPWVYWLVGIGPGRFADFFPLVQPLELRPHVYYLHNDLLQLFLELGAVRAIAVMLMFAAVFISGMADLRSPLKLGMVAAILSLTIHSLGDFNLQLAGVAVIFWTIAGAAINPKLARYTNTMARSQRLRSSRRPASAKQVVATEGNRHKVKVRRRRRRTSLAQNQDGR